MYYIVYAFEDWMITTLMNCTSVRGSLNGISALDSLVDFYGEFTMPLQGSLFLGTWVCGLRRLTLNKKMYTWRG